MNASQCLPHSLLSGLYQIAYVTTNLDEAMHLFAETYGISKFEFKRDIASAPGMPKMSLHIAHTYVGPTMIEVIQPVGGQGLMFGYACNQTKELMPLPILLAHQLTMKLAGVRKQKVLPYPGPDGKSQVTVEYRDGKPARVDYVVIAAQHTEEVVTADGKFTTDEAKQEIIAKVVRPVLGDLVDKQTKFTVNGTGKFLVGGPQADTGMTGRKIMVDTYGGWAVHGGGAISGKDPTKVDRSAGYMARYIAKNLVAAELADECLVQLAYCIGLVDPVSVMVNTYGTGKLSDDALSALVRQVFPLSPKGMIDHLKLTEPVYQKTAAYGHFGRSDQEFTWERVDATDELLAKAKKA